MSEEHKNIHEAIAAVMTEVEYVQKQKAPGLNYSFAGEAALIDKLRPAMVKHGVMCYVTAVHDVRHDTYQTQKNVTMNRVSLVLELRFAHAPSTTEIVVMAAGEGTDVGDKGTPKAMTGAFKYALRETFCLETGDDPDETPSSEQERGTGPEMRSVTREELERLAGLMQASGLKLADIAPVLGVEGLTAKALPHAVTAWLSAGPREGAAQRSVDMLVELAAKERGETGGQPE